MKKGISLFLCLLLLFSLVIPASAIPLSSGTDALNAQFLDGANTKGHDYVYYSPLKGSNDSTKYPLLIWLHGAGEGGVDVSITLLGNEVVSRATRALP